MEGAGKGGPKPQQQNKPKQNKPQQNQNKKGGGGGGNSKGEKKPGNPNAGGPKLQKTETSESSSAEPAKVSIEVTSPTSPTPVAEEVKPTGEGPQTPQVEKPTPLPNLLPEQLVGEGKNIGKGNQQGKRNASKSPAKGGHQNKNPNSAAKNAQEPPAIPPRAEGKSEGMVPDVEAQVAKETVTERGNTSAPVPIAPQLSLGTEQSKETARGKSPSKNNQNPKGGKGNKSGNLPNKSTSQPPAVPPRSNQPAPAPGKVKNPTIQQPVEGIESSSVEIPKAAGAGCPDPKNNAQGKNSQNPPKKSKSQAKGGGGSSPSDDPLKPVPQSTPVETTGVSVTIPVEIPQSFAEKAKSPAPKGSDKVQAEKTRAESPAKSEQTQSKNKAGKNGSSPQMDKSLVEVPPAAPQELPRVESLADVMPANIDLPKNQQSHPSTPSPVEQKECELKNSQKNKNQKKQSAKTSSPPKADNPPLGASSPSVNQTSKHPNSLASAPIKEPTQAVAGEDFEPLFSDLSNPVAKPSQPAHKESPKQAGKETVDEIFKTPGAGGPAEKEALKSSVAEPPKPLVQEKIEESVTETAKPAAKETPNPTTKESQKPAAKETPNPGAKETQKPAAKETPNPGAKETQKPAAKETPNPAAKETQKPVSKETPKPAAKETPKPTIQETPKPAVKEAPKPTLTALESEDGEFDPLFSDLTDSTKALVGIACPFVDKFPPLTPPAAAPKAMTPEPKHQSPVGTPGTEPKSPQHQSKKSKSPPNKALPPQSGAQAIPKSAPVEIERPSAGSPLQGNPTLPDSWRDKVMSDVKLSSSPKRSVSPKLSSSPKAVEVAQKKEENKNQGNGKKAKTQAPLDPNEPTKVTPAVAAEVPLKPEEPKSDANEHKVDKKVGNQKPSPPKVTRAQDAPKAPVDKKEDGARSTKLQKGNPTPPEPTNQPIQRPAPKKETFPPKNTPYFPTNGPNPELTPKKKGRTFKGTKKDRKNKKEAPTQNGSPLNSLAGEVAKARQHIKNSLQCIDDIANMTSPSAVVEVSNRLNTLEKENSDLKQKVGDLTALLAKLEVRVKELEKGSKSGGMQVVTQNTTTVASQAVAKATHAASQASANVKTAGSQVKTEPAKQEDDDDGVDLFGSDSEEEDEEANKIKEQRRAEYAAKKAKKPTLIAKSSIILDVKPWDDETNMEEMEKQVRKIEADGLLWGASKLVPLAYGIHKLQINCVVEDEKISIDWLQETIEEIGDFVQSVDIAAFNKI